MKRKAEQRLRVGMTVVRRPLTVPPAGAVDRPSEAEASRKPMRGKVCYIHPRGRFHTVEFAARDGRVFRESFQGTEV